MHVKYFTKNLVSSGWAISPFNAVPVLPFVEIGVHCRAVAKRFSRDEVENISEGGWYMPGGVRVLQYVDVFQGGLILIIGSGYVSYFEGGRDIINFFGNCSGYTTNRYIATPIPSLHKQLALLHSNYSVSWSFSFPLI